MLATYTRIARPEEEHNVLSPTDYVRKMHEHFARARRAMPSPYLKWPEPHAAHGTPIIRQGRWLVACACGNFPVYDPEWQLAVCFECAAIYTEQPPAQWREIEQCLMRRPVLNRNMEAGETLAVLRRENDEHGLGEGA